MIPFAELVPGVRRIVAPNPSMMTGPGTNTYLFGTVEVAVLDPGPNLPVHLANIRARAAAPIRWIIVTHTHPDHSPGAAPLAEICGAELIGMAAAKGDHQDATFIPDRVLRDGDVIASDEFSLQAIHTPGHASNHFCFHDLERDWLFTGDHVIDGSTVVINPPDGDMSDYLRSLHRLRDLDVAAIAPGHGEMITNPAEIIDWIVAHRLQREAQVFSAVRNHAGLAIGDLVRVVYQDVAENLYPLAERSLLAHLLKLQKDGRCLPRDGGWSALPD
jgi:glyoxylase-like metal-dependent hydrolase (beta-lactamase superfamily II)